MRRFLPAVRLGSADPARTTSGRDSPLLEGFCGYGMASAIQSSSLDKAGHGELDDLMGDLGIQEEDIDDVIFKEENHVDQNVA